MLVELFIRVALVGAAFPFMPQPQPAPHSTAHKTLHAEEDFAAVAEVEVG